MSFTTLIFTLPLISLLAGVLAGSILGWFATPRAAAWALAAFVGVSLVPIVQLVLIGPGEEEQAFTPFVSLTAGMFPALFGAVMGWLGGRALIRRRQ